jgi:hypothetical protein
VDPVVDGFLSANIRLSLTRRDHRLFLRTHAFDTKLYNIANIQIKWLR